MRFTTPECAMWYPVPPGRRRHRRWLQLTPSLLAPLATNLELFFVKTTSQNTWRTFRLPMRNVTSYILDIINICYRQRVYPLRLRNHPLPETAISRESPATCFSVAIKAQVLYHKTNLVPLERLAVFGATCSCACATWPYITFEDGL